MNANEYSLIESNEKFGNFRKLSFTFGWPRLYIGVTPTSSEKSTRTWNGNVCDPVSRTTWSARDERLWRCHCSLRRFSSMTCITKWSLVRVTQKRVVDDIIKSGSESFYAKPRD
jgi:hypothetical protein